VQRLNDNVSLDLADACEFPPVRLPVEQFCVRQVTAIYSHGQYWLYVDVVPWDHRYWPDTYDTTIHAYSSDDCRRWNYHGEILAKGDEGEWDAGGVATPGAVVLDGRTYLFYAGRHRPGPDCIRQIGLAVADQPQGPFVKMRRPIVIADHPENHLDDPVPIVSASGRGIDLYYRHAEHHLDPPPYSIRLTTSDHLVNTWTEPIVVLQSDDKVRAYETAEAIRINGQVLLATFDHFHHGHPKTALRWSSDGTHFVACDDLYLDDHLCAGWQRPSCMLQFALIPDADGVPRHMGICRPIDDAGHYNMQIHSIRMS